MDWVAITGIAIKITVPTILVFFALGFFEKKELKRAVFLAFQAGIFLGLVIFFNILFAPKFLGEKILPGQFMNFTGQIAMLMVGLIFVFGKGSNYPRQIGLFIIKPKTIFAFAILIGLLVFGIGYLEDFLTGATLDPHTNFKQKLWFEATLPGISEEIVFRGILLDLANRFFRKRWNFAGAPIGLGILAVSIPFGLGHLISPHEMSKVLMLGRFISTFTSAFLLTWLKEKTRSLPACMVAHNLGNALGTFADFLSVH